MMTAAILVVKRLLVAGALLVVSSTAVVAETRTFEGVTLEGQFTQGGMLVGTVAPGSKVTFNGKPLSQTGAGQFAFGFGRDDSTNQTLQVLTPDGKTHNIDLTLDSREYNIQRVEGVPARTVNPDPSHLKRIQQEASEVSQARYTGSHLHGFLQAFLWPVEGPITGVYGSQRVFNGEPRRPHFGIDIAAPEGTEIHAPADGAVTLAHPDMFFSGGTMVIDHGHGINTSYLHMSKMLVKKGDLVKQGDVIGLVGATGRATGPHLCWRLNWYQTRLDPQLVVPEMKKAP